MQEQLTQTEHARGAEHPKEVEEQLREVERHLAERDMQVAALTQQLQESNAAGEVFRSSSGCFSGSQDER